MLLQTCGVVFAEVLASPRFKRFAAGVNTPNFVILQQILEYPSFLFMSLYRNLQHWPC